jgi:hypothetical protein
MNECCPTPSTTPPAKIPPVEFCVGNYTIVYQDGRMVKVPRSPAIIDGIYVNPTITIADGCITAIEQGTGVLYSECDPCATPAVIPPAPATITLDGDGCNLLSLGPDGLMARLITMPSSCMTFVGCGTIGSPLSVEPTISTDPGNALECRASGLFVANPSATSGVNVNSCGIIIQNGLVVSVPFPFQPVLSISADPDGSVTVVQDPNNPCSYVIGGGAFTGGGIGSLVLTKGIKLFAASTDLPADPSADGFFWGAVGAANPRQLWGYVDGSGWREIFDSTASSLQINI